jgi:hypothetical protein
VISYLDEEVEFSGIVGGSDDLLWRKAASKSCNFVIIKFVSIIQCCGSGSGAFLAPGSGMGKKSGSGSGMNSTDHISQRA